MIHSSSRHLQAPGDGSLSDDSKKTSLDDSITSLHDSVPSLNTNIYQYYGLGDSNLVPITEEDEKSSFNNNKSDLEEFKRGGVARSTIRNSKKKNFKELKLDMTMCKNNLEPAEKIDEPTEPSVKPGKISKIESDLVQTHDLCVKGETSVSMKEVIETKNKIEIAQTPESPFEEVENMVNKDDFKVDKLKKNHDDRFASIVKEAVEKKKIDQMEHFAAYMMPNKSTTADRLSASPNLPTSSSKNSLNLSLASSASLNPYPSPTLIKLELKHDFSLSEGEEMFDDLSSEIQDNLSEDEELFDTISMNIDIENADEDFQTIMSECDSLMITDTCDQEKHVSGPETNVSKVEERVSLFERKSSTASSKNMSPLMRRAKKRQVTQMTGSHVSCEEKHVSVEERHVSNEEKHVSIEEKPVSVKENQLSGTVELDQKEFRKSESDELQIPAGKPTTAENEKMHKLEEEPEETPVLRKIDLKKDIAYWEKRASASIESRLLAKNYNENFKRGSLQRSTLKRSNKKVETSKDHNLRPNSFVETPVAEMLSEENDLLKMTSREKSANTVPYSDGAKSGSIGCSIPQSIKPKPAPRKNAPHGRTKILELDDTNTPSSHLPKLATTSDRTIHVNS